MGKRLRKPELLAAIDAEYTALNDALALCTKRQMTEPGVTRGGWSVKDILAHLLEWQQMNIRWYEAGRKGEKPEMPAPGIPWREIPRLNKMIYDRYRRRSLQSVMNGFRDSHNTIVSIIKHLSDEELVTLGCYSWTGPSWTLSDYFRANTVAHYLWARTRIRRWQKKNQSPA